MVTSEKPSLDPVVFLGGAFQDMYAWQRQERALLPHASVITLDLPGWGRADTLPDRYGVDFLAQAVERALQHLGAARVNVVGCSYGSLIAHRLGQRRSQAIVRMALGGAACALTRADRLDLQETTAALTRGDIQHFARVATDRLTCSDEGCRVQRLRAVRRVLTHQLSKATTDTREKIIHNTRRLWTTEVIHTDAASDVPTMVFTGEHDTFTPPAQGHRLASAYPNGTFVTIDEADHLVHLERDREYCQLLLAHFRGADTSNLPFCKHFTAPAVPPRG
ncbi:alpha/beta hydrolase [Streptomyces sp. Je 1-332]|uniref:alpha/beta fold hydrolase n=1 Tax=Streptomyces sp. Je 1-332 TaxID=3231270 RepID=UPI00345B158C